MLKLIYAGCVFVQGFVVPLAGVRGMMVLRVLVSVPLSVSAEETALLRQFDKLLRQRLASEHAAAESGKPPQTNP